MTAFVDTSALYALLNEADESHQRAVRALGALRGTLLVTHTYVVVETFALVGRRLGWPAVERLHDFFLPLIDVHAVDADLHATALHALRESGSDNVSLADRTSFALMRKLGVEEALAFDSNFIRAGFRLVDVPQQP